MHCSHQLTDQQGKVLEIGPGAGHTLRYYKKDQVQKIYGTEPKPCAPEELRARIDRYKLEGLFKLYDISFRDTVAIEAAGITKGSFDTVSHILLLGIPFMI